MKTGHSDSESENRWEIIIFISIIRQAFFTYTIFATFPILQTQTIHGLYKRTNDPSWTFSPSSRVKISQGQQLQSEQCFQSHSKEITLNFFQSYCLKQRITRCLILFSRVCECNATHSRRATRLAAGQCSSTVVLVTDCWVFRRYITSLPKERRLQLKQIVWVRHSVCCAPAEMQATADMIMTSGTQLQVNAMSVESSESYREKTTRSCLRPWCLILVFCCLPWQPACSSTLPRLTDSPYSVQQWHPGWIEEGK